MDNINVKLLTPKARSPIRAHESDAGWDLHSCEDTTIRPGKQSLIATGVSLEIPEGMVGLIWPRSGIAVKNGIDVFAGVIDSGYRGEIKVCLHNAGPHEFKISQGDRIAQILFQRVAPVLLSEVGELQEAQRGESGFGSSGK